MTKHIEQWIDQLLDQSESLAQLEVIPTMKGWSAKIVDQGYLLLDSDGEIFMVGEGNSIEDAIAKLNKLCVNDLNKITASA